MEDLIFSLVTFIIIYLFYVIFVISRKSKLEKMKKNPGVLYLVNKYKIDLEKVNLKVLAHLIALTNAFILSITLFIVSFVDNYFLKILVCFVVIIPFEYIMYMIIGKMYKENRKKMAKILGRK